MPFFELKHLLAEEIATGLNDPRITAESLVHEFNTPPNMQLGHLALPCFRIAKLLGKSTDQLTKELSTQFTKSGLMATSAGPYTNFKWDLNALYSQTIPKILKTKDQYGSDTDGKDKRIVLEYCSPNIAKKLAFQHIRSTLIGNTLANVYEFLGFKTERINFVGDWGTQFARLLAAVEQWGDPKKLSDQHVSSSMDHLLEQYVRFHRELENNPQCLEWAAQCLQRLENAEPKAVALWKTIRDISCKAMEKTLTRMNIQFNHVEGESNYLSHIEATLDQIKKKAGAKISDGAWIVEVDGISTPALVQKRDGTTLYLTRDIAAAQDRHQRLKFDRMLYVVSEQQKLHFQLLFGVLNKMGCEWSGHCEHVSFGTVLFGSEKMSTREGRVIVLDDLLDEAHKMALEECTKKNPDLPNKEEVAEQVGIGAIIFGELSSHRQRDIHFDWKEVLALDGETGPYVQYALVRCYSLLEKADEKQNSKTLAPLTNYEFSIEEEALLLSLSKLRAALHQVIKENEPYHLTHYLIDLAKAFNRFYYKLPVLQANDPIQRAVRLDLVRAAQQTLANGLNLLGMRSPKEM